MEKRKDNWDGIIKDELEKDAELTKKEVEDAGIPPMPDDLKEKLRAQIHEKIENYEKQKVYEQLSEEDREALRLGREIINRRTETGNAESESNANTQEHIVDIRKKTRRSHLGKRMKICASIAAMLVLILEISVTSKGGAERVSSIVRMLVGKREVVKINSDEDRKIDEKEDEEKAYEEIKEEFGIEPVKPINTLKTMKFVKMRLDKDMQIAELYYSYREKILSYIVSSDYYNSSLSFDADDELLEEKEVNINGKMVELRIMKVKENSDIKSAISFQHKGLYYFIFGYINEEECMKILNNMYFY